MKENEKPLKKGETRKLPVISQNELERQMALGEEEEVEYQDTVQLPAMPNTDITFTLERDGMHIWQDGRSIITLAREQVALLAGWLDEQKDWIDQEPDPNYEFESNPAYCRYCRENLPHSKAKHEETIRREASEQKVLLDAIKLIDMGPF
jgi:hypothetical protein